MGAPDIYQSLPCGKRQLSPVGRKHISCLKIKGQVSSWHMLAVELKTYFVSFDKINIHSNTMEFAYILDEAAKLSNYDKVFFSIIIWSIYAQKLNQDTVCSCHGNFWQMRTVGILEKDSVTYYPITFRRWANPILMRINCIINLN